MDKINQRGMNLPWVMDIKAVSTADPSCLVQMLTDTIISGGGWVLHRDAKNKGVIDMLIEFECQACLDIYSKLIEAGLELSEYGHRRLTELCKSTLSQISDRGAEIASVSLEIQTFSKDMTAFPQSLSACQTSKIVR